MANLPLIFIIKINAMINQSTKWKIQLLKYARVACPNGCSCYQCGYSNITVQVDKFIRIHIYMI